jgi:hypothetical protein
MPIVVPSANVHSRRELVTASSRPQVPSRGSASERNDTMIARLGRIGAHAAAKNRRRVLSTAVHRAVKP